MRSLAVLAVLLSLALAACGDDEETAAAPTAAPTETTAGCRDVEAPPAKPDGGAKRPQGRLDAAKTWTATVKTSCGDFAIRLDVRDAPKTAASFAGLADQGFFDDTIFHRIVPGFVIQGGDPTQEGNGGPGYTVIEPPPSGTTYAAGTVAMAKTATEPAGASGSQFYVVSGDATQLPPEYALLGKVSAGMDVVERIGQLGNAYEEPIQPVVVSTVTVAGS